MLYPFSLLWFAQKRHLVKIYGYFTLKGSSASDCVCARCGLAINCLPGLLCDAVGLWHLQLSCPSWINKRQHCHNGALLTPPHQQTHASLCTVTHTQTHTPTLTHMLSHTGRQWQRQRRTLTHTRHQTVPKYVHSSHSNEILGIFLGSVPSCTRTLIAWVLPCSSPMRCMFCTEVLTSCCQLCGLTFGSGNRLTEQHLDLSLT